MSWVKGSDKAATFPKVLNAPHFSQGEVSVNEMFGFIMRCGFESAAHRTDYIIEYGVAMMMGGPTYQQMIDVAVKCGLFTAVETDGAPAWKIVEDPDFIHLITRAEQDWMNQQKRDSRDTKLTSAARLRDGDACRYCSKIVYFGSGGDKRSARAGTYMRTGTMDHVISGEAATLETFVVACGSCNSKKKDNDDSLELLAPPAEPFYSPSTALWLAKHGHQVQPSDKHPLLKQKPTTANGTESAQRPVEKPSPAAPGRTTQATEETTGQGSSEGTTPGKGSGTATDQPDRQRLHSGRNGTFRTQDQPDRAGHLPDGSGFVGSGLGAGRDGTGSEGLGGQLPTPGEHQDQTLPLPAPARKRRRSRPRKRKAA